MAERVDSAVDRVSDCLSIPFSFLRNYKSNLENLRNEVDKLINAKEYVQHRVNDARRKGEVIEKVVEKWLSSVDEIIDEVGKIMEVEEKVKNGLSPDLVNRYKLSRKVLRKVKAVVGLREEGRFDKVSFRTIQQEIWLTSSRGYVPFKSRMSTLMDILKALCSSNVNMVGVYGMAGIGKTMLVKEVARQAKETMLFHEVVFVKVSQTPDIKKIQGEIGDKLCLEFSAESELGRARMLYERLREDERILVILDDIWTSLDLEMVGIPFGDDHGACKVLLTARNHEVLSSKMGSQNNYLVHVLNEEESWSLFKKMAGDCTGNCELQPLAIDVTKACGGLPIAIVTIARALSGKGVFAWENALQTLRRPSLTNFTGMFGVIHSTIELSYNHLESEELKSTFLLCSLMKYSYDASVMDLLKYGMGLGLFEGINTIEEARVRVYTLVHELKSSCLLLDGHTSEWFSMHDVVRHFAISIASRDQGVFMLRNEVIARDWPDEGTLKSCTRIFIHDSNTSETPIHLEYPQLKLFYLNVKDPFFKISDHFFAKMQELRVLNLTKMHLLSLPRSFYHLVNLQTLCLDQCRLGDITVIGELKRLEILSFVSSDIGQLPREIGKLTRLKLLDLSNCSKLKLISPNVIAGLSRLEELYMGNSFVEWEVEGNKVERINASLHELKHLSCLTSLEIHIQDDKILPEDLFFEKLKRYKIFIGDEWDWSDKYEYTRTLKLKLNTNFGINNEIIMQLKGIESLDLDVVLGIKNVLYDLGGGGFPKLKNLNVQNNPHIICIVDSMKRVPFVAFPALESLLMRNLTNLEKVCHGHLTTESFRNLRILKVRNCDKLRNIFSFSIVKYLRQLQKVEVIKCKNMEEIFAVVEDDDVDHSGVTDKVELGQLRSLTLKFLPRLRTFYSKMNASNAFSNEIFLADEVLMPFFNEKVVYPNLEFLELCAINYEKIWHSQLAALPCIQNLTHLIVRGCDKLKFLFPSSVARNFVQLQHLEVCYCLVLEDIVAKDGRAEADLRFIFPQVTFLKLWNLPELRTFYPGIHTSEWPSLKRLEVSGCDKVNIFASEFICMEELDEEGQHNIPMQHALFLAEKAVSNMQEFQLSGKDMIMIQHSQFPEHLFDKLKILEVVNEKSAILPLGFLQRFRNLEKIELRSCSYKEIVSHVEVETYAGILAQIKFLKLWELSNLKYMWKQDSKLDSILQNLETLEVWWCNSLINLVPPSTSFQNLTNLELWYCKGLRNLLSPSTAKSLVQLIKMSIDGCEMMTEIIACEGDVAEDKIIFSKLKCLSLVRLESLTSFCNVNYAFKFPSLEDLFVIECSKMKIFSPGILSIPKLLKVQQNWELDEGCWEGDLNTTIWQLHTKKIWKDSASETCQERTGERNQSSKGIGINPHVKLKVSIPPCDEVFTRISEPSWRSLDRGLLVNRDGYRVSRDGHRIVYPRESGAPSPIKPSDNQLNLEDVDTMRIIAKGNGTSVHLLQHKWTCQFFALKAIKFNSSEHTRRQIARQLKINRLLQSPYTVLFYRIIVYAGGALIIMEYMDGGSLADFLKKVGKIPEVYLAAICKQVLKGLVYLHYEQHIIHRDLKPSNLLINHRGEVKFTDFGLSTMLANTTGQANTFVGTRNYMSPERITGSIYGQKCDIWSFGLVMLECATGQFPYSPPEQQEEWSNFYELMEAIVEQPAPRAPSDQFSLEFCSFISACLQKDPRERHSAQKLITHPFMNTFTDLEVDLATYFTNEGSPLATI